MKQLNDYASGARYVGTKVATVDPNSAMMLGIAKRLTPGRHRPSSRREGPRFSPRVFHTGHLDGTITDTLSQYSGRFDGQLSGSTLSGDFRLPQPEGDDQTGVWDAQLQSS